MYGVYMGFPGLKGFIGFIGVVCGVYNKSLGRV